jgi:hypothetical protein
MHKPKTRKPKKKRVRSKWRERNPAPRRDPAAGQTITEFCAEIPCSESTFHHWRQLDRRDGLAPGTGRAPRIFQPFGHRGLSRILPTDKAAWRERRAAHSGQTQS